MAPDNDIRKKCVFCGESIPLRAGRCPYCGSILETRSDDGGVGTGTAGRDGAGNVQDPRSDDAGGQHNAGAAGGGFNNGNDFNAGGGLNTGGSPNTWGGPDTGGTYNSGGQDIKGGYGYAREKIYGSEPVSRPVYGSEPAKPLSNGMKVFLTAIFALVPAIGQLAGIITAILFMNSEDDGDRKSFGAAILVLSLVMFALSCIAGFIAVITVSSLMYAV